MLRSLDGFGWQAARKRLRAAPDVREELAAAFQREDELQEEVQPEFSAPPSKQLENMEMKCNRLRAEGCFLAQNERYAEALQHWEEALLFTEDVCERAPVLEQMAQVLLILDRSFDAIRTAEQAVESRPLWYAGHLTLGRALLNFGELERAVECLRRSAALLEEASANAPSMDGEELAEVRLELAEAEKLYREVRDRASTTSDQVIINGRVVESHFWECSLPVLKGLHDERAFQQDVMQFEVRMKACPIDVQFSFRADQPGRHTHQGKKLHSMQTHLVEAEEAQSRADKLLDTSLVISVLSAWYRENRLEKFYTGKVVQTLFKSFARDLEEVTAAMYRHVGFLQEVVGVLEACAPKLSKEVLQLLGDSSESEDGSPSRISGRKRPRAEECRPCQTEDAARTGGMRPSWQPQREGLHSGVWLKLEIWAKGRLASSSKVVPEATAAVSAAMRTGEAMAVAPGRAALSLVMSGATIMPHCGPTNHRLRLHMPLLLPGGLRRMSGLTVAGEARDWELHRCLIFDDSFEHQIQLPAASEAEPGLSGEARVVLLLDLWHPDAGETLRTDKRRCCSEKGAAAFGLTSL
ncbi:Asph [Symbiodinium pilosum]|uniref:Asph protein n=1 Tax=Symbiodinium pilosum TaxID=2952 RepID=A0A812KD45_SYMPI|nr:Asph [Symbiodinium pilosum]